MTRVLWTEYRRGVGPVITALTAVLSVLFLYDGGVFWPGPWMRFAENFRSSLLFAGPVVVALAAWQAGRDRHRELDELLASTARAPWKRVVVTWLSVTVAAVLGLLVPLAVNVAVIAPHADYLGGEWQWVIVGVFAGVGVHAAFGVALGALIPMRLIGPVLGLGLVVVVEPMVTSMGGRAARLVTLPRFPRSKDPFVQVWASTQLLQLASFAAVAVLLLAVVAVRHRIRLVVPVAVALVLGTTLAALPVEEFIGPDTRASELVCAGKVCTTRADADLLPLVTDTAERMLARVRDVPGAPVEALPIERAGTSALVSVPSGVREWSGGIRYDDVQLRRAMTYMLLRYSCAKHDGPRLADVVQGWWTGELAPGRDSVQAAARLAQLKQLSVPEQNAWVGRALSALRSCDPVELMSVP